VHAKKGSNRLVGRSQYITAIVVGVALGVLLAIYRRDGLVVFWFL
jgi:hypothetical protein